MRCLECRFSHVRRVWIQNLHLRHQTYTSGIRSYQWAWPAKWLARQTPALASTRVRVEQRMIAPMILCTSQPTSADWLKKSYVANTDWLREHSHKFTRVIAIAFKSPEQTRKHCCGNICDSRCFLKVSLFAHLRKHCCWNKICFPGSKNVSYQIQKHFMFPKRDFCCGKPETLFPSVCPPWETWRNIGRKQCFRNNVWMFPSLPKALAIYLLRRYKNCKGTNRKTENGPRLDGRTDGKGPNRWTNRQVNKQIDKQTDVRQTNRQSSESLRHSFVIRQCIELDTRMKMKTKWPRGQAFEIKINAPTFAKLRRLTRSLLVKRQDLTLLYHWQQLRRHSR